jgi:tetratricopeptide (TPR) repeat protein
VFSIAVDVQGSPVVFAHVKKFGVTFPVGIDTADVFGQAFNLKAIPVSYLVDEVGIIRLQGGGPNGDLLRKIETILKEPRIETRGTLPQLPSVRTNQELEKNIGVNPDNWKARLALANIYDAEQRFSDAISQLQAAAKLQPRASSIPFVWGLVLLHQNQTELALKKFKSARDLDRGNWRIHKQIWAIEHPEKFYSDDSPDFGWQKEELAREKEETR